MARVSRPARARALREARQLRSGEHRPLGCQTCGEETRELRIDGGEMRCVPCIYDAEDDQDW